MKTRPKSILSLLCLLAFTSCNKPDGTITSNPDGNFISMKELAESPNASLSDLQKLLESGHDINQVTNLVVQVGKSMHQVSATPLMIAAAKNDNPEVIKMLIDSGAKINSEVGSDFKKTIGLPIDFAAAFNTNPEVIRVLVNHGARVTPKEIGRKTSPIVTAALLNENPEIIRTLVEEGADVNARRGTEGSQIKWALWEFGVLVNASALHEAALANPNIEVIKQLIRLGADIEAGDDTLLGNYGTPLFTATRYGNRSEVIELLIQNGADVNATNGCGMGLMQAALLNDSILGTDAYWSIRNIFKASFANRYHSADGLFSYEIPLGWEVQEFPGLKYKVCRTKGHSDAIANINTLYDPSNLGRYDYWEQSAAAISGNDSYKANEIITSFQKFNSEDPKLTTGSLVTMYSFTSVENGVQISQTQALVGTDGGYLVFTLTCSPQDLDYFTDEFKKLVLSTWILDNKSRDS